ncbi:MAG: DUF4238 domain-containing protein [Polyangiaceae bacterium]|nr:DUF4238 domain-containing protein [Polyangiaceae bacterium]
MSAPVKHHYVPQAYLAGWAGPDGRLFQYSRIPQTGKLYRKAVAPSETARLDYLYTTAPDLPFLEPSFAYETKFFGRIDREAAEILAEMRSCPPLQAGVDCARITRPQPVRCSNVRDGARRPESDHSGGPHAA